MSLPSDPWPRVWATFTLDLAIAWFECIKEAQYYSYDDKQHHVVTSMKKKKEEIVTGGVPVSWLYLLGSAFWMLFSSCGQKQNMDSSVELHKICKQ